MFESKDERLKREAAKKASRFTNNAPQPKNNYANYKKGLEKIAQEQWDAKIKRALDDDIKVRREFQKDLVAFWSQPLAELKPAAAVFDVVGGYTVGAETSAEERRVALAQFIATLNDEGITLTEEATAKFAGFVTTLTKRGVTYSTENLVLAMLRMCETGIFVEGRDGTGLGIFKRPTPAPVVEPTSQPTVDELALSTETREGRKAHLSIVNQAFSQRFAAAYSEFYSECKAVFEGFDLTDTEAKYLADLIDRRNLAPTAANFHKVRVLAAKSRHIRPWLTNPERYEIEVGYLVENTPVNGTADRIDLNRRIAELKQKYAVA